MSLMTPFRIVGRAARQYIDNRDFQMGAATAYYALFSMAPLLVLTVALVGFIYGEEKARQQVREHLTDIVGPESAEEVGRLMEKESGSDTQGWAAAIGLGVMIFGALRAFLHIRRCLWTIWKLEPPHGSSFLGALVGYPLAILMLLCVGLLLFLSLIVSTSMSRIARFVGEGELVGGEVLWERAEIGFSFLLVSLFFALIFRVMSGRQIGWGYVLGGAVLTSLLFTLGKVLIGFYLAHTSTITPYGAASSLVALLVWVYYSAQIFFFGAELIQAWRTPHDWESESA